MCINLHKTGKAMQQTALLLLGLLASCASTSLPRSLESHERAVLSSAPLPFTVGVESYKYPAYSQELTELLAASGAFIRVAPLETLERAPDYTARVEKEVYGTAMIPSATIATGGVVPSFAKEKYGVYFSLTRRGGKKVTIDATYDAKTVLGFAALPLSSSPDYSSSDPEKSERYREFLLYKVLHALGR